MNEFNYDDSAYLAHHGVKGMHWGVRKSRDDYRAGRTSGVIKSKLKNRVDRSTITKGDEKYLKLTRRKALAINNEAYKATLKRKGKRLAKAAAIGAGIGIGAAAIGAGAAGIQRGINNKNATRLPGPTVTPMTKRENEKMYKQYRKMGMM